MLRRLAAWLFRLRCRTGACPGIVVSGWRGDTLMIGWLCLDCGRVKDYHDTGVTRPEAPIG